MDKEQPNVNNNTPPQPSGPQPENNAGSPTPPEPTVIKPTNTDSAPAPQAPSPQAPQAEAQNLPQGQSTAPQQVSVGNQPVQPSAPPAQNSPQGADVSGEAISLAAEPSGDQQPQVISPASTSPQQQAPQAPQNPSLGGTPPPPAGGTDVSQPQSSQGYNGTPAPSGSHKKLAAIIASVVLILGIVGFVFGYYLPNQPENVYKTGLDRTGDAMHDFIVEATEQEQLEELSRMQATGRMELTNEAGKFEGDLSMQLDETKTNSAMTIKASEGMDDFELDINTLTEMSEGERFPDVYFQVSGIAGLGLDAFIPGVLDYDGQWIEVSSSYLEEVAGPYMNEAEENVEFTVNPEDYAEVIRVVSENVNEYVFTSDEEKAVLQLEEVIGEEEFDDIRTYRYDVSVSRENAYQFCDALVEDLAETTLMQELSGNREESTEKAKEECRESVDEDIEETDLEMWVDRRTRLIHKIRATEKDDSDKYTEVGQRYQGGDELELFVHAVDPSDEVELTFTSTSNVNTNTTSATMNIEQGGRNSYTLNASLQVEPYDEEINTERPDGAIPIETVIEDLFSETIMIGQPPAGHGYDDFGDYDDFNDAQLAPPHPEQERDLRTSESHPFLEAFGRFMQ